MVFDVPPDRERRKRSRSRDQGYSGERRKRRSRSPVPRSGRDNRERRLRSSRSRERRFRSWKGDSNWVWLSAERCALVGWFFLTALVSCKVSYIYILIYNCAHCSPFTLFPNLCLLRPSIRLSRRWYRLTNDWQQWILRYFSQRHPLFFCDMFTLPQGDIENRPISLKSLFLNGAMCWTPCCDWFFYPIADPLWISSLEELALVLEAAIKYDFVLTAIVIPSFEDISFLQTFFYKRLRVLSACMRCVGSFSLWTWRRDEKSLHDTRWA